MPSIFIVRAPIARLQRVRKTTIIQVPVERLSDGHGLYLSLRVSTSAVTVELASPTTPRTHRAPWLMPA